MEMDSCTAKGVLRHDIFFGKGIPRSQHVHFNSQNLIKCIRKYDGYQHQFSNLHAEK